MEQFDIINELRTYATEQGWKFIYALDDFEANEVIMQDLGLNEHVLVAGFNYTPTIKNRRITSINYSGLMSLGRKFDADGQAAMLDETQEQKHDRRLKELVQMLSVCIAEMGCRGNMTADSGLIQPDPDKFDENIDFATANTVSFIQ